MSWEIIFIIKKILSWVKFKYCRILIILRYSVGLISKYLSDQDNVVLEIIGCVYIELYVNEIMNEIINIFTLR